jgi:hypothetical protein
MPMASAWRRSPLGALGIILTESELNGRDQSFRHSQQNSSLRPQSRHQPWRHQKLDRQHSVRARFPPPRTVSTPSLSTSIVVQMLLTLGFSTVMASTPCFPLSIPQLGPGGGAPFLDSGCRSRNTCFNRGVALQLAVWILIFRRRFDAPAAGGRR